MYQLIVLADPVRIEGSVCVDRFPTKKCKALLCYLAACPSHRARRGAIIADLWPEEFEDVARKALRQTLYHVRTTVKAAGMDPDLVRTSGDHVWLESELLEVDLDRFQKYAAAGFEDSDFETARVNLTAALEACSSGFDGCDDGVWVAPHRERLADLQRRVRLRICRGYLQRFQSQCAHDCAMAVIAEYPYDESAYEVAIRALLQLRDRAGARDLFDRLEREVGQDLDSSLSLDWEDLASSYPTAEEVQGRPLPLQVPRPRNTLRRSLAAVGLMVAVLIGGWSATGFGSQKPPHALDPNGAETLLATVSKSGSTTRIAAVQRVFEAAWKGAYGGTEDEWAAVVRRNRETIRRTLSEAQTSDPEAAVAIAGAGWRYFSNDGTGESIQQTLREALAKSSQKPSSARARALCALSFDISETGKWNESLPIAEKGLRMYETLGDAWGIAHGTRCVGFAYAFACDWDKAHQYYSRALDQFKRLDNREGMAVTQLCLSFASYGPRSIDRTRWTLEAYASYLAVGNEWGIEYAGDALRTMIHGDGLSTLSRQDGLRSLHALEDGLARLSNPLGEKGRLLRKSIVKVAIAYAVDESLSRQLAWYVGHRELDETTAARFYGASGGDRKVWSWLEQRIQANRSEGGRLAAAVAQGKQDGLSKTTSDLQKQLGF